MVIGMVADWPDGGTQDLDNPSRLHREFYGWVTSPQGPTISDLPFRTGVGRWATRAQFVDAVRAIAPTGGALPPHLPSTHQTQWQQWLMAAGVDLEQIRFQAAMNASESPRRRGTEAGRLAPCRRRPRCGQDPHRGHPAQQSA